MLSQTWQNRNVPSSAMEILMDALTEKLGIKLQEWKPEISDRVRQYISEIIDLADRDVLDLLPSRTVEQDVLDSIDEP
jgi:hypothetical protein